MLIIMKRKQNYWRGFRACLILLAIIIFIVWLIFGLAIFGKPMSIWATEKATNKRIMPDVRDSEIVKDLKNFTNSSSVKLKKYFTNQGEE